VDQRHIVPIVSCSRSQISNRIEDGLIKFVRSLPLQPPVEYLTHIPAIPPQINVILVVGHGVLDGCESKASQRSRGKRTRIAVKRALAEPRAIWTGGIPQASFAMFKAWMNTSSVGITTSRPFVCWDTEAIAGVCKGCEESVWEAGCDPEEVQEPES
jgi:hypothetical protein